MSARTAPWASLATVVVSALLLITAAGAAPVTAVDDTGATVTLAAPAQRVVSLAPHLTELLFGAGAGAQVVGAVAYSDYPEAARTIPRIGDSQQLDLERLVTLRPDLIVVWQDGTPAPLQARVAALGIPVYAARIEDFAGIASTLRRLGHLTGHDAEGAAEAAAFGRAIDALRARYAARRPLRVFYQVWARPLMTVNGRHLISQALAVCGARNVFAELAPLVPTVDVEAVIGADPDAIVSASVAPPAPDPMAAWRSLRGVRATREGHLIAVDPDTLHRATERTADGVRALCEALEGVREREVGAAASVPGVAATRR
ncbi:MAG: helical backbone metal receptor [Rubrivivax sp.]